MKIGYEIWESEKEPCNTGLLDLNWRYQYELMTLKKKYIYMCIYMAGPKPKKYKVSLEHLVEPETSRYSTYGDISTAKFGTIKNIMNNNNNNIT